MINKSLNEYLALAILSVKSITDLFSYIDFMFIFHSLYIQIASALTLCNSNFAL